MKKMKQGDIRKHEAKKNDAASPNTAFVSILVGLNTADMWGANFL